MSLRNKDYFTAETVPTTENKISGCRRGGILNNLRSEDDGREFV